MTNVSLRLSKKICTLDSIHSAILSFRSASCKIDEDGEYWLVDIDSSDEKPIQEDVILRRIDEYSLRESLEKKFGKERDEIIALAFGQE